MNLWSIVEKDVEYDYIAVSVAYWSWGSDEAVEAWRREYACQIGLREAREAECHVILQGVSDLPLEDSPHREHRYSVLRDIGWQCEGDSSCDCCGLYEMDGEVPVCDECCQCDECGHADDCPNNHRGRRRDVMPLTIRRDWWKKVTDDGDVAIGFVSDSKTDKHEYETRLPAERDSTSQAKVQPMTPTEQLIAAAKDALNALDSVFLHGDDSDVEAAINTMRSALAAGETEEIAPLTGDWLELQGASPDMWISGQKFWRIGHFRIWKEDNRWNWNYLGDPRSPQTTRAARKLLEAMGC